MMAIWGWNFAFFCESIFFKKSISFTEGEGGGKAIKLIWCQNAKNVNKPQKRALRINKSYFIHLKFMKIEIIFYHVITV